MKHFETAAFCSNKINKTWFTLNQVFGARPENKPVTMQRGDASTSEG
jgi:hypothetical protein